LLVAGREEAPPVLYVAARTVTLVRFEDLVEPRALPGPKPRGRVEVAPFGERALGVSPVRDLEEGERLELEVAGRTEAGEPVTLRLTLVTRKEVVDAEAWVSLGMGGDEKGGVSSSELLASHEPGGSRPRLTLRVPEDERAVRQAGKLRAWVESVLQVDGQLFVTVVLHASRRPFTPWRFVRARLEVGCHPGGGQPVRITSSAQGQYQLHTFTTPMPEGAGCVALTLEEDGPRTLRFEGLKVSP
jgi:Protein of unknown function (DUF2381)